MKTVKSCALAVAVGFVLAACSSTSGHGTTAGIVTTTPPVATAGQGSVGPSSGPGSASSNPGTSPTAESYVRALESGDPDTMRAALKFAAAKSPAAGYLSYLAYFAEAQLDGGSPESATDISPTASGDGFESCDDLLTNRRARSLLVSRSTLTARSLILL